MTYLRILALIDRVIGWAMHRCDSGGRAWAELADLHGHVSFRQLDYVKRVRAAAGWEPVEVNASPASAWNWSAPTVTTSPSGTVTYRTTYRVTGHA